ncbi:MAG: aminotransferase class I/II-fold pyridoxal phosphate-dependent enzyme [Actinobacteria bacterium]|nr:MAG: aminotransferase class I/II-fold pyridoxal phosphate-dependent enzyme [Actinomycetota bacterium]
MRPAPDFLERLPQQYFTALLARVAEHAALDGEPLVDLGRGNPEVGPPQHVIDALAAAANESSAHRYPPFRGLPALREAIARYSALYGVELDPHSEVTIMPGTKTAICELALVLAERGSTIVLPDPYYPDYPSGAALAGARTGFVPLDRDAGWAPDFAAAPRDDVAAVFLNYPSNPCAVCVAEGTFAAAVGYAHETGAAVVHDFAYGDIVFDGRTPSSFLAEPGAREVGVEMFSMSKTYGMAGWRLGFVVGNAEIVSRLDLLADHARVGIFTPVQHAGIAALTGPQDSVAERVETYRRRRELVREVIPEVEAEGSFYLWWELPEGLTPEGLLEHRVAVAPGEGFGSRGAGWARLSLAVTDEVLETGLERLVEALG